MWKTDAHCIHAPSIVAWVGYGLLERGRLFLTRAFWETLAEYGIGLHDRELRKGKENVVDRRMAVDLLPSCLGRACRLVL
jgi:hypothetical protein